MFYTYVIQSLTYKSYLYIGHCENIEVRLKEHNAGKTDAIRPFLPFRLVYSETFKTRNEAIEREKFLKTAAGRGFLRRVLKHLQNSENIKDCPCETASSSSKTEKITS